MGKEKAEPCLDTEYCSTCATKTLYWSMGGSIFLAFLKLIGGVWAESSGLIADGVQSITCVAGCILLMYSVSISRRPRNERFPYGYGRMEFASALVIFSILFAVGAGICLLSAFSIMKRDFVTPSAMGLPVTLISAFLNYMMYRYSLCAGKRLNSSAMMANAYQTKADMLSSYAVCAGLVLAQLGDSFAVCDPLAACAVGVLIIQDALHHWLINLRVMLDSDPEPKYQERISTIVSEGLGGQTPGFIKAKRTGKRFWLSIGLDLPDTDTVETMELKTDQIEVLLRSRIDWIDEVDFFFDLVPVPTEQ